MNSSSPVSSSNRLAGESSPYLLQHAHNPVEWYPWGDEALQQARARDKPILLSIGYSACHWCHVMAHESFEDEATARVMNDLFINIKVDREERPDLDRIYQTAHQLITRRGGGWPLTVILTPDSLIPFFAGTYFPREPRYGLPGFKDLLQQVNAFYRTQRADVGAHVAEMQRMLERIDRTGPSGEHATAAWLDAARTEMEQQFDGLHGGFGHAPKFPHPTYIERLLRHVAWGTQCQHPDDHALHMARCTLQHMAEGGVFDQLGGGFYRYSVDERWDIPHFEKMLYDNGQLFALYSAAWQLTGEPLFARTTVHTAEWLMREMQTAEGGYCAALDADSAGHEGAFYVWDAPDIAALLDATSYALFARYYGIDRGANFEGRHHLRVSDTVERVARQNKLSTDEVTQCLARAHALLFARREQRERPGRDDKVLTSWNALAIHGMLEAGFAFARSDILNSAERALAFLQQNLWRDGRLYACYKDNRQRFNAYLDDYAFLLRTVLTSLELTWSDERAVFARAIADRMLELFEDKPDGGLFFTSHDHEQLPYRPKIFADDATPSGNGIAAYALNRLGHLTGDTRYLDAAQRIVSAGSAAIAAAPLAHGAMLLAAEELLRPPTLIILRGESGAVRDWQAQLRHAAHPRRMVVAVRDGGSQLPGGTTPMPQHGVVAYRCDGFACSVPLTSLAVLERELDAADRRLAK